MTMWAVQGKDARLVADGHRGGLGVEMGTCDTDRTDTRGVGLYDD